MKSVLISSALMITLSAIVSVSVANDLIVFPAKGQSNEQMEKDKYACYGWSKKETGFDPMAAPKASTPPPSQTKKSGGVARGGVGGAALGGIVGGSSGAKKGLAAGGLVGGAKQGSANKQTEQKTKEWEQQEANKYAQGRSKYSRAYSACIEGKGYTVK